MLKEDIQSFDLVLVLLEVAGKFINQGLSIVGCILVPFGSKNSVKVIVIDGLFFAAANVVNQVDEVTCKDLGSIADELLLRLLTGGIAGIGARR